MNNDGYNSTIMCRCPKSLLAAPLTHSRCHPDRCFKGSFGKVLSSCKYGFPFKVPQLKEELDEDHVRYLYIHRHDETRWWYLTTPSSQFCGVLPTTCSV